MAELFAVKYSWLIPLLPLIGAMVAGFLGARFLKQRSHWPIWIGVGASAALSISLLVGMLGLWGRHEGGRQASLSNSVPWFDWITAGGTEAQAGPGANAPGQPTPAFSAAAGAWIDPLTAVMLCVVCGIGLVIIIFAAGYMKGESGYFRFFAYLGLFIFSMTMLVMANNFVMLYLGWEGVGLCSYLLIGYYYEKPTAREAAKKAFLVNRIGDFGFGLGIMLIFVCFGTVSFFGKGAETNTGVIELARLTVGNADTIPGITVWKLHLIPYIPFLLMLGAFGKSAQFPLYVWLPDAMEGPTPVSALIHAATMVTAGVYMIVRCGTLFVPNEAAMLTIACIGAFTAIFAASIALRQFDLKKIFAYSTISQLGFMFVAAGVFAPVAGIFHLVTHAFFKALLFLSAGVVMHAMGGELDLRKFSGLKSVLPRTRWLMLIGCAALAGFPLLSGFFSKDEIVAAAWSYNKLLGLVLLLTALMTAYYTFRLYFRVFEGPQILPAAPQAPHIHSTPDPHAPAQDAHDQGEHNHEPAIMIVPLIVLAIGAMFAGWINPHDSARGLGRFLGQSRSLSLAYDTADRRFSAIPPVPFGAEEIKDKAVREQEDAHYYRMMILSGLVSVLGIYLAYLMHLKDRSAPERLALRFKGLTRLLEGKYWVDEIYQSAIVEPLQTLGRAFFVIDRIVVDGVVWLIGFIPQAGGFALKLTTQRGYVQGYAATMLFGVAIILLVIFW